MKNILFLALSLLFLSCEEKIKVSGHRVEEAREISGYDKIQVSSGIRATINYAQGEGIVVKTFSSVQEYVKTYVANNTLYVEIEDGRQFDENPNVIVIISAHDIKVMTLTGGVIAKSDGTTFVSSETVSFHLSGGSSFNGGLTTNQFDMELTGGSSVKLTGSCVSMSLQCSGGGDGDCADFQSDMFSAELSGGAQCKIIVNDRISKASLSGGSRLYYRGTKIVNNVNISGGSQLISRN